MHHYLLPGTTGASGRGCCGMDMVLLDGPELLEGLPPSPMSRSPFPCFIHSLGLTVSLLCPFQSFLNRRDLRFLSDMKNALGIWGRKQVDRIVLRVTESELTHNLFLGKTIFFLILHLQGNVLLVASPAIALLGLQGWKAASHRILEYSYQRKYLSHPFTIPNT